MATLTQLSYVVAVDQLRHFGRAARACFVSQPTLSMQLQKLEEELGVVLFDRSKQPIQPTAKGKEVIIRAKQIIQEVKELEFIGKKSGDTPAGEFHLAVIPTLSPYLIPLFLTTFAKQYPLVELYISEMKTDDIVTALEDDQLDAALLVTPLNRSTIREKTIFYEPFYLYVNKDHALYNKTKVNENDLDKQQVWLLEEGHCLRNQITRLCARGAEKNVLTNVHFASGNLETLKQLVKNSSGFTLLPYLCALQEGNISQNPMIKPFVKPVPSREVSLVYRRDDLKQGIMNALFKTIEQSVPSVLPRTAKNLDVVDI